MIILRPVQGPDLAVNEDDIVIIWAGQEPDQSVIEFFSDRPPLVVLCEFNTLIKDAFGNVDLRPKAELISIRKKK